MTTQICNDSVPQSISNILVVGSWAKEQIIIENLQRNPDLNVYAYMDIHNPGIMPLVKAYGIGSLYDIPRIVDYAKEKNVDLVLVTTAAPLANGIVNALVLAGIPVFGPDATAARLESDKAFARNLMKEHGIGAIPPFAVFEDAAPAIDYARDHNWQVAVKPTGLTQGLGVRVYGDQLKDSVDVTDYIRDVISGSNGNGEKVLIEKQLHGVEFTLQCLVDGETLVPTPAIQDFKKRLPGENGPNTASMGSYAEPDHLLPFLSRDQYDKALSIMQNTVTALAHSTDCVCRGFLYGQFMITADGLMLIEYNFRPGDPEWMNTLCVFRGNLADVLVELMNGGEPTLDFEHQASVCKYLVPPKYPDNLNEVLDVAIPEEDLKKDGVGVYYSCGLDTNNKLNVGDERGIALLTKDASRDNAHKRIEAAIKQVSGDFHHREDIGSNNLIERKIREVAQWK